MEPSASAVPARAEHYPLRILDAATAEPQRPIVFWRDGCVRGGQLAEAVRDAAAVLQRSGAGPGRAVALLMASNRPELLVARYAAHLLGSAVVHVRSMNPRTDAVAFDEDTQAGLLELTGAAVLVVDDEHVTRGRRLVAQRAGTALVTSGVTGAGPSLQTPRRGRASPHPAPARSALAAVTFTSGSTGGPKAIGQSFGAWNRLVGLLEGVPATPPPRFLASTPMSHTVAPVIDAALAAGGSVVLHEGFDATAVLRCVEWLRVTDLYLAVPHLVRLLEHPGLATTDTDSLRRVVYSGTPASPGRVAQAFAAFGDVLVQVYGTGETGGITCLTGEDHREPVLHGTVGRPFPWVDVELRDPDSGAVVARPGVGEVHVRTPTAMEGYLHDRPTSAWHATGDLARFDPHGYLVLVGRRRHVIKAGGLKIHPAAVERVLLTHPAAVEAVVYGHADADRAESVHAAVVGRPGASAEALGDHVAAVLGPEHRPARLALVDAIPLTPQGKPDIRTLVERTPS